MKYVWLIAVLGACAMDSLRLPVGDTASIYDTASTGGGSTAASDTAMPGTDLRLAVLGTSLHRGMGSLVTVQWEQGTDETVHVEYQLDGAWISAPSVEGRRGANEQLLVGLPFSGPLPELPLQVPWRLVAESDGFVLEAADPIETGPRDPALPVPTLRAAVAERWHTEGNYLLTTINEENGGWTGGQYWVAIYDRMGQPVWALRVPDHHWSLSAQVSLDGDSILWDESTMWSDGDQGAGSEVHRTWLDREMWVLRTPGLHQPFVQLPDGRVAWASRSPDHGLGESIVEAHPDGPAPTVVWRCEGWSEAPAAPADCAANSLAFHDGRGAYLVGLGYPNAIVEVDRATSAVTWWAGAVASGYRFSPTGAQFQHVHGASWTPGGNLLVSTELVEVGDDPATVVREYSVSRISRSLSQVWSYEADEYATANSRAERLDNDNLLLTAGSASEVREVDSDGRTVWHLDFDGSRLLGRGSFIDDLYDLVSPPAE